MKLDVGGGKNPKPGFKVLDLMAEGEVDYACPSWATPIKDDEVTELNARHFFEHLSPDEARKTLKEWYRIMAPGAKATVTTPNLLYHAKQLSMPGRSEFLPDRTNFEHAINSLYGWRDFGEFMGHQWGYTPETLIKLFKSAGFEVKELPCRACDILVEARKPK